MSFTNVFGGSTLQAAQVAYRELTLSASVELLWPEDATDENYLARLMDVTPTAPAFSITLPPANQVSTGMDFFIRNLGASTFDVLDNSGSIVASVTAGSQRYFYCTDNTTEAGGWSTLLMGVGSGSLDAASVAGYGIKALSTTLNADRPVTTVSAGFTIAATDRAKVYVWTGGVGTITLPSAASATNGFFFEVRNGGTGVLTISVGGGDTVDGGATMTLQVNESCSIHSGGGTAWYSVGRGRNTQFNFTQLIKNVTGGAVTLNQTEAANVVQKYQGVLVSNCTVTLPYVVQVYYVSNATTGAYSLTFQANGGTTVTVPQGQNAILFCDGTNVINASTTVAGIASLTMNQGTVGSPSINYSGDVTTGFYQPAGGQIAMAITGVQKLLLTSTGLNNTAIGASTPSTGAFTTLNATGAVTFSSAPTVGGTALANTASPTFTGTPAAPTAAPGTNTTQIATTAFVTAAIGGTGFAPTASPVFTGNPTAPTPTFGDNDTSIATTAFVQAAIGALGGPYAPLASPTFTGTPAAPTAAVDTNTTQIATTAFVLAQAGSASPLMNGSAAVGTSTRYARQDHSHPSDTSRAPISSPSFSGSVSASGTYTSTGGSAGFYTENRGGGGVYYLLYVSSNIARLWHNSAGDMWTVDASGNFVATGNVTAYSDVRVKSEITPIKGALDKISRIRGYKFFRNDIKQWQEGLIAQELKLVLPHSVHDQDDRLSVSLAGPVALLFEGVNELRKEVAALRSKRYH